jgi:hypothetical protein
VREVFRTTSLEEAQVLCSILREHEIEPFLDGEQSGATAVGLYTSASPLRVLVADEQEAPAQEILAARQRNDVVVSPELPVLTPEEDARFEESLRRSRDSSRKKVLFALMVIAPVPLAVAGTQLLLFAGQAESALYLAFLGLALGAPVLLAWILPRPASPLGGKAGKAPGPGPI